MRVAFTGRTMVPVVVALFACFCAGLLFFFHCSRTNPLDAHGKNYIPGTRPEARFLKDTVVAYMKNDVSVPFFARDTAAVGGRTPLVRSLCFSWTGDSSLLDDTLPMPSNDAVEKYFDAPLDTFVYMRAIDNDGETSALATMRVTIYEGRPRLLSLQAEPSTVYVNDTATVTASAVDDNGTIRSYIWSVNSLKDSATQNGILKLSFSTEGTQRIIARAMDDDSLLSLPDSVSIQVSTIPVVVDTTGPQFTFFSPADNDTVNISTISVTVTTKDPSGVKTLLVNNGSANLAGGTQHECTWLKDSVLLQEGANTIPVLAIDNRGNLSQNNLRVFYNKSADDITPPSITFVSPRQGDTVYFQMISVNVNVVDISGKVNSVKCNGLSMTHAGGAAYVADSVALNEGLDTIHLSARDDKGNEATKELVITYKKEDVVDTVPPSVLVLSPRRGAIIAAQACTVSVSASDQISGIDSVTVNGLRAIHVAGQLYARAVALPHGRDTIIARAFDKSGNRAADTVLVLQNAPPVFAASTFDTSLIQGNDASISIGATDGDGDSISFSFLTAPQKSETQPVIAQNGNSATISSYVAKTAGIDTFKILAADRYAAFDTMAIRIFISTPQETKPFFVTKPDELIDSAIVGSLYGAELAAIDPNNKPIEFSLSKPPTPDHAQIDTLGRVAWTPEQADTGRDTIVALVSNGTESDTIIWTVRVIMPNLPPVLTDPADTTIDENQELRITLFASDPNNDNLTFSMASFPAGARLTGNVFTWKPTFRQAGGHTVLFRVQETGRMPPLSDSQSVTITVRNVNLPPVLGPIGPQSVIEKGLLSFTVSASDTNNDSIAITMNGAPSGATLTPLTMRMARFLWTPDGSQAGAYGVTFYAIDNGEPVMSDSETVMITVVDTARPAFTTTPDSLQDTVYVGNLMVDTVRAADPDNDPVSYAILSGPGWLTVDDSTGILSGAPKTADITDSVPIVLIARDPAGLKDTLHWTMTVLPMWPKVFGGPLTQDTGFAVIASGQSFAVCGNIRATESQIKYPFFLKTDGKGNPFSFVPYLHPVSQRSVYSMAQASDGGYLLCGTDSSATVRMLVIKTNENGDTAWSRTYSVNDVVGVSTRGVSVCATREGGFIVCGVLQRQRGAGQDAISSLVYIVKANSMGAVEWQKELTRTQLGNAIGYSIQQPLGDEGYIICGEIASRDITSGSVTGTDMFIVKTDARGDTLWTKTYNRGVRDVALSVQKDADGYVIGGYSVAALSDMVTGYIMKVNSRGDSLWTYPITTVSGNSAVISVRVTPDNGSIAAGYSHNSLGSGDDALLVKLSSEGKEVWRKTHGSLMAERAYSVAALSDSGFVYTGFTTRTINNSTSTDIYLVRTDANGNMVQE